MTILYSGTAGAVPAAAPGAGFSETADFLKVSAGLADQRSAPLVERGRRGEQAAALFHDRLTGHGELDTGGQLADQRRAHDSLQLPDLPADRLLGHRESDGGAGHAALLGDRRERLQQPQVQIHAADSATTAACGRPNDSLFPLWRLPPDNES